DGVQHRAPGGPLDPEAYKPRCVTAVDRGPAVLAVADIAGGAVAAVGVDDPGDEPMVAGAVDGRREPHAHRPHAALGERAGGLLGALPQDVDVLDVAAQDRGARRGDLVGGGVRAGQAEDLVSLGEEFGDDGRSDPTGRAGDEYTHDEPPGGGTVRRMRADG